MRSISLAILFIFIASINFAAAQTTQKAGSEKNSVQKADSNVFKFLRKYDKKYPYEFDLLNNATLKPRLKTLLGLRFAVMKKKWSVESPIEIKNDLFIAYACQPHNCDVTNFMIIVDIKRNIVYVGFREEEKIMIYAEDGTKGPAELQEWSVQK